MLCPTCKNEQLNKQLFYNTEVDYCPKCLGIWFEKEELAQAKDEKDKDLNWLDFDLWQDEKKFKISPAQKACPTCEVPLYAVFYGDSQTEVDLCNLCCGVWLDRGEFKKIMDFLKAKGKEEILKHYLKNLLTEAGEIITGPEPWRSEMKDFITVLKLLSSKFAVQHQTISEFINLLPK